MLYSCTRYWLVGGKLVNQSVTQTRALATGVTTFGKSLWRYCIILNDKCEFPIFTDIVSQLLGFIYVVVLCPYSNVYPFVESTSPTKFRIRTLIFAYLTFDDPWWLWSDLKKVTPPIKFHVHTQMLPICPWMTSMRLLEVTFNILCIKNWPHPPSVVSIHQSLPISP